MSRQAATEPIGVERIFVAKSLEDPAPEWFRMTIWDEVEYLMHCRQPKTLFSLWFEVDHTGDFNWSFGKACIPISHRSCKKFEWVETTLKKTLIACTNLSLISSGFGHWSWVRNNNGVFYLGSLVLSSAEKSSTFSSSLHFRHEIRSIDVVKAKLVVICSLNNARAISRLWWLAVWSLGIPLVKIFSSNSVVFIATWCFVE